MNETRARRAAAAAALAASAVVLGPGQGLAQQLGCGDELYTVQAGDSLSEIALRAYSSFNYGIIFDANRDVLESPAVLLVGQQLFIPCLDGSGPATRATALGETPVPEAEDAALVEEPSEQPLREAALQPEETEGALAAAADEDEVELPEPGRPVRFLTGSNFAPFTGRDLPEGGMLTDVVNRAIQRADPGRLYEITWENDWERHLSELLPDGAHDLGFPWYRPDCSVIDRLSEAMRARCTDFEFSNPLYEVTVGYYVPTATPEARARDHAALEGMTVCRPAGYFTFDLEEVGLVEPRVSLVRPDSPGECFEMLAAGQVDVVTVNALLAEREIADLGLDGKIEAARGLASTETLHVLTPRSNAEGRAFLSLIDRGLRQLREEGIWADITAGHLAEHAKSL